MQGHTVPTKHLRLVLESFHMFHQVIPRRHNLPGRLLYSPEKRSQIVKMFTFTYLLRCLQDSNLYSRTHGNEKTLRTHRAAGDHACGISAFFRNIQHHSPARDGCVALFGFWSTATPVHILSTPTRAGVSANRFVAPFLCCVPLWAGR